tara:strand:- start:3434 stop:4690 length:1257 start_codon:yes stop_codon:yes gene_type:complete
LKLIKPSLVFILPRNIWPPFAGQARLCFYRAKELKKKGYKLTLIYFCNQNKFNNKNKKILKSTFNEIHFIKINNYDFFIIFFNSLLLRVFKKLPLQASWLNSPRLKTIFKNKINLIIKNDKKIIFHFYSIRSHALWSLIDFYKQPFVIDLVDSMSLNIQGKISNLTNKFSRIFWFFELKSIKYFENNLPYFSYCKRYFTVSKIDRSFLNTNPLKNKIKINIHSIGSEISEKLFKSKGSQFNKNIIFFGSLDYEPNLSSIYWLLEKVMPKVWEIDSNIILNIAGKNPPQRLIDICNRDKKILLIPNPDKMSDHIQKSMIAVLPLISGSGQQNKILEAISNGLPVITTNKGAQPFGFINNRELLVEDNPVNFSSAIIDLFRDYKKINKLRENAFSKVKENYTWSAVVNLLDKEYKRLYNK